MNPTGQTKLVCNWKQIEEVMRSIAERIKDELYANQIVDGNLGPYDEVTIDLDNSLLKAIRGVMLATDIVTQISVADRVKELKGESK